MAVEGAPRSRHEWAAFDTLVHTQEGLVPIQILHAGNSVLTQADDLRDGKIRFMYEMVPNGDCDTSESDWQFVQTAFAREVESHGSYFVGEWGVRVRSVLRRGSHRGSRQ